jgi:hypothetical protein
MGSKEWCFFYLKDRKYPTGKRINRATKGGYWKATGREKAIFEATTKDGLPLLVGMKKTLVFYKGRAPRGKMVDWSCMSSDLKAPTRSPTQHPTQPPLLQ